MNKKIKVILMIILFFLVLLIFPKKCNAANLDEITNYTTTVSPRDNGTLDINYHIEWKVLDSTTEGPLEWVKIGIPNQHVDSIKKISNTIKSVKYTSDGGNYVKVKFKKKYYAGETVTFEFSIHQSYMYTIDNSTGKVTYTFTPGWFEDIEVKQATVKWLAKDVTRHTGGTNGEYIVWSRALAKNQKLTAKVEYSVGRFNLNYNKQASNVRTSSANKTSNTNISILMIFVMFIIVYVIFLVFAIMSPTYYRHGGYGYYGGYYPYYYHHHHHYHGGFGGGYHGGGFGGGGSSGGGSSCACACACAGGGRAGCAKKDFYGTNLKIDML